MNWSLVKNTFFGYCSSPSFYGFFFRVVIYLASCMARMPFFLWLCCQGCPVFLCISRPSSHAQKTLLLSSETCFQLVFLIILVFMLVYLWLSPQSAGKVTRVALIFSASVSLNSVGVLSKTMQGHKWICVCAVYIFVSFSSAVHLWGAELSRLRLVVLVYWVCWVGWNRKFFLWKQY